MAINHLLSYEAEALLWAIMRKKHFLSCVCKVRYYPTASAYFPIPELQCFFLSKDAAIEQWAILLLTWTISSVSKLLILLSPLFPWPLRSPLFRSLHTPPSLRVSPGTISSSVKNSMHAGFQSTNYTELLLHSQLSYHNVLGWVLPK